MRDDGIGISWCGGVVVHEILPKRAGDIDPLAGTHSAVSFAPSDKATGLSGSNKDAETSGPKDHEN